MSETVDHSSEPKSIRQKRILDAAADRPDASIEAIADKVPSASPELVERALEEYGDPANSVETPANAEDEASVAFPDHTDLTEKQLEVTREIAEDPTATQRELAETLGVSATTISNRVD